MSGLKVVKAGILTLIQDKGRFGLNHLGVSSSGYLDEYSALWANKLLDNDSNDALLEILFGGVWTCISGLTTKDQEDHFV